MKKRTEIEEKVYSTFAEVAGTLGYSPVHGKIIGALLVRGPELSLKDLAEETGYSVSMISLSLDLLELLGVIKKVKKPGDRNLYVSLQGDLLGALKNAITIRVQKSITSTLSDFEKSREELKSLSPAERKRMEKTLEILEKEIKRLERYMNLLSRIRLP